MTHNQHFDIYIASCCEDGGIFHYSLSENGEIKLIDKTACQKPMYMVADNNKMYVLLREPFEDSAESGLIVYDIASDGKLINPSKIISTKGEVACHLMTFNESVYAVNYISGSVIKFPDKLILHHGRGVNKKRQEGPHTHFIGTTPDKKYICVADLGLDSVFLYDKDLNYIDHVKVPLGHGARHIAFSEDGRFMFVANELMSTVSAFSYSQGKLSHIDTKKCLPADFNGESTVGAIRVHNGDVFVSNRGHDSIARMSFDSNRLTYIESIPCGGRTPRDFDFAGDLIISCNQDSGNVVLINEKLRTEINIKTPLCVCVKHV